jgi:hypothetical protein
LKIKSNLILEEETMEKIEGKNVPFPVETGIIHWLAGVSRQWDILYPVLKKV